MAFRIAVFVEWIHSPLLKEPRNRSACQLKAPHVNERFRPVLNSDSVRQRPPETFERNYHLITVFQPQAVFKAEHVRAEKVDVRVARPAMLRMLEMMVLEIC